MAARIDPAAIDQISFGAFAFDVCAAAKLFHAVVHLHRCETAGDFLVLSFLFFFLFYSSSLADTFWPLTFDRGHGKATNKKQEREREREQLPLRLQIEMRRQKRPTFDGRALATKRPLPLLILHLLILLLLRILLPPRLRFTSYYYSIRDYEIDYCSSNRPVAALPYLINRI